ncbi:MAG TPA: ATP-dependent metallopeptidase FtsH/Yme1/Tma family protein, partial [Chondromyces sp.]|nr:ATP-dependent metallopeptidase FtsH/Yme1/Tma family protein [Chondromyces sp.]
MNRIFRYTIFYLLVFLVIIGVVSYFNNNNEPTDNITYNEFISYLEKDQVESFSMQPERGVFEVRGQLKGAEEGKFFLTYVMNSDTLLNRIDEAAQDSQVEVMPAKETSGWVSFFTTIIP